MKAIRWDGKKITQPGMYSGLDLDRYHGADICDGPSISSSGLRKIFNESPAHFFCEWRGNPDRIDKPMPRHFILGRAAHHLMLGEPNFAKLFALQPDEYEAESGEIKKWNNNAKACRDWQETRRNEGRLVLTATEVESVKGMAFALGAHPIVKAGALNGAIERSLFCKDKATGIWLKARPDTIPGDSGDFVDLKSTTSVQWNDLVRTLGETAYHMQGALVRQAAREVLGVEQPTFTLVFVEKSPPYCVRVVTLKDGDLDLGDKQNRAALDTFARCLKSKHWPGPGGDREDAEYIELGSYARTTAEERLIVDSE